jgi:hypothetical protein
LDAPAELLASPADLSAQTAVLVNFRVSLTFRSARRARDFTRFRLYSEDVLVRQQLPRKDARGREADRGAVEVQAHAPAELLDMSRFTVASVGTARTR